MENKTFTAEVTQDANGNLQLVFPITMLAELGWAEGDEIEWDTTDDGARIVARKANDQGQI